MKCIHVTSHTTCMICMDVTESDTSKKGSRTHEHQNFCMLRENWRVVETTTNTKDKANHKITTAAIIAEIRRRESEG